MDIRKLSAPCGLDCFNCELYEENITEKLKELMAENTGMEIDSISCKGCRVSGCSVNPSCATLECVNEKKVEFCFECTEFPCEKLAPSKDGADTYPHNMKVYNLCRMKKLGIEEWAKEADRIRQSYFRGKFVVGRGPVLD